MWSLIRPTSVTVGRWEVAKRVQHPSMNPIDALVRRLYAKNLKSSPLIISKTMSPTPDIFFTRKKCTPYSTLPDSLEEIYFTVFDNSATVFSVFRPISRKLCKLGKIWKHVMLALTFPKHSPSLATADPEVAEINGVLKNFSTPINRSPSGRSHRSDEIQIWSSQGISVLEGVRRAAR